MAIRVDVELAPNVTPATPSYPEGSSKSETAPGVNDGTPQTLTRANDIFGPQQAMLKIAGIAATGNPDTALDKNSSQYMQAILMMILSNHIFDDSGVADAYVLDVVGNNPAPASYKDNMSFQFIVGNTNTGASTVDVESLGIKSIRLNGIALTGGEMIATERVTVVYDLTNDWFELVKETGKLVQQTNFQTGAVNTGTTVIPLDDSKPQNTEGDEFMTLLHTPRSSINKLKIEITINLHQGGVAAIVIAALFQNSTVDSLAAVVEKADVGSRVMTFTHHMVAGTTSPITFKVRAGSAGGGTVTFNGASSARLFGGVMASSITITETKP